MPNLNTNTCVLKKATFKKDVYGVLRSVGIYLRAVFLLSMTQMLSLPMLRAGFDAIGICMCFTRAGEWNPAQVGIK